jgi:hypothetical protein
MIDRAHPSCPPRTGAWPPSTSQDRTPTVRALGCLAEGVEIAPVIGSRGSAPQGR